MAAQLAPDEDDDEAYEAATNIRCVQCDEAIHLAEEVFLIRIALPVVAAAQLTHYDITNEHGDFTYAPAFFCFSCWEEEAEELQEQVEDTPPVVDASDIIQCGICRSGIHMGELVGVVELGELQWSQRVPSGHNTHTFDSISSTSYICIACIYRLDTSREEALWPDDIEPIPDVTVCIEGIFERCWRYGGCTCLHRTRK